MPRRKRADGAAAKVRLLSLSAHLDDNSMDDGALDGDLEDYGSPVGTGSPHQPLQRNAANARERARMRVLSRAFCRLKVCMSVNRGFLYYKFNTIFSAFEKN
ncbi:uncharacterized protein LOC113211397, partial [Frankliniella occidentalis]|uniref:Uncharacterized protein LOC113211397 n=1 Tax=Frankliniella occidentalis TaxID=133901 RepID=A0A9C6XA16_FRAOC